MSSGHQTERYFFQWPFLEQLANNQVGRLVSAIPIVGYLILFNDQFANAVSFHSIAGSSHENQSLFWFNSIFKLRSAFIGSLLILFANILFAAFAPKVLKASKDDLQFSERVFESYSKDEIVQIESEVTEQNWKLRTPWLLQDNRDGLYWENDSEGNKQAKARLSGFAQKRFITREYPDYVRLLAREWWHGQMQTYLGVRLDIFIFSTTGYMLLALPTLDILQAVLRNITSI